MKIEKYFLPILLLVIIAASSAVYLMTQTNTKENLVLKNWCISTSQIEVVSEQSDCDLILSFSELGDLQIEDNGSSYAGKWSYNGDQLFVETEHYLSGTYNVAIEDGISTTLHLSSETTALFAIGFNKN